MSGKCKPYRLLSPHERQTLQQHFLKVIDQWNQEYPAKPIHCQLTSAHKPEKPDKLRLLQQHERPLALVDSCYLSFMNDCHFLSTADCFDDVSENLFISLIKQLLTVEDPAWAMGSINTEDWFYPGSPCLALEFTSDHSHFDLYLHPEWVLAQLPDYQYQPASALGKLHDALAEEHLELQVVLEPFDLPVNQLLNLQVGDLIKTDHRLTLPLHLQHEQKIVATVDIGQNQTYKSIQLRKSS
ncbi:MULTISPECIES: FliM/FliN family flagellar motor C-terminal domain-containing protein [unclassified Legionella]|uniref:FliM/FliN family flagellar motor C-terminal domain-containing protein n=1 Tax=unclassified Legionella TaxID=2622702 RepID=UPI001054D077|nr:MULTISPECIES: FliM/FliN family flagellar motor C-terminal domain-containing protein [unclassified Legionella]MDI9817548.1 FliM/FliN family flagellar motor C-terminal domain-containing protein [Legionella sp. PL877]